MIFTCSNRTAQNSANQASTFTANPRRFRTIRVRSNASAAITCVISTRYGYTDPVVGADAATFTVLHADLVGSVAIDAQHVYYRNHIVTGADPDTFEFLPACVADDRAYYVDCDCTFYAKDQHRAYWVCTTADEIKPIKSKSLDCFTFFIDPARRNYGFARDAQYEYNAGKRKALPKT